MYQELIILELILASVSIISLIVLKQLEFNIKHSKLLYCFSNIGILLLEAQYISHSNYSIIAISSTLLVIFYYRLPDKPVEAPQINVLNTQVSVSDKNHKVEPEFEFPLQLPAIPSLHESNSSNTPIPVTNEYATKNQSNNLSNPLANGDNQVDHGRKESGLSFLGENKRSSYSKNSNQMIISRQQSVLQIQPHLNVIKYQDDFGEVKFGILKTLKSVSFDQVGKEVECMVRAEPDKQLTHLLSAVEETTGPRLQILYESQQQQYSVGDKLRGAVQFNELEYDKDKKEKLITWKKIFKEIFCLFILSSNLLLIHECQYSQLLFFGLLCMRQMATFHKLQFDSLMVVFEFREVLIWIGLIFTSLTGMILINVINQELALQVFYINQWITILITFRPYKIIINYFKFFSVFLLLITVAICILK